MAGHWENRNTQYYFANCTISHHELMISLLCLARRSKQKKNTHTHTRQIAIDFFSFADFLCHEWPKMAWIRKFQSIFTTTDLSSDDRHLSLTYSFIIYLGKNAFFKNREEKKGNKRVDYLIIIVVGFFLSPHFHEWFMLLEFASTNHWMGANDRFWNLKVAHFSTQ